EYHGLELMADRSTWLQCQGPLGRGERLRVAPEKEEARPQPAERGGRTGVEIQGLLERGLALLPPAQAPRHRRPALEEIGVARGELAPGGVLPERGDPVLSYEVVVVAEREVCLGEPGRERPRPLGGRSCARAACRRGRVVVEKRVRPGEPCPGKREG